MLSLAMPDEFLKCLYQNWDLTHTILHQGCSALARAVTAGAMPLLTLRLAENGIGVLLGVELVQVPRDPDRILGPRA